MTRNELRLAVLRFRDDPNRVISIDLFCELAGISPDTFTAVFRDHGMMTKYVQVRCERALKSIERGEVKVMRGRYRKHTIEYRYGAPQPDLKRTCALNLSGGKIGLKIGVTNANDYTKPTFLEQLEK